jgi:hypothetical protein
MPYFLGGGLMFEWAGKALRLSLRRKEAVSYYCCKKALGSHFGMMM